MGVTCCIVMLRESCTGLIESRLGREQQEEEEEEEEE